MGADDHRMVEAEYGVVREVEDPAPGAGGAVRPRTYGIEITVPGACDRCAVRGNCYGAGSLVMAESAEDLTPGETVRLEMRRGTVLAATAWVYGIPLIAVFLGTAAGYGALFASLAEQPRVLLSFGLGVALMAGAGLLMKRLGDSVAGKLRITAVRESGAEADPPSAARDAGPMETVVGRNPRPPRTRTRPHPVLSKIRIKYDPTEELTADESGEIE